MSSSLTKKELYTFTLTKLKELQLKTQIVTKLKTQIKKSR